MSRPRLSVQPLEVRDTPAVIAGAQLVADALAATPPADFTGPLGGTVSVSVSQQGNSLHQTLVWVGPRGETLLTEDALLTINPRTGAVTGTLTATGANGRTVTGTMAGQLSSTTPSGPGAGSFNKFEETTTFVGNNGRTVTQHGVYVGGDNSLTSTAIWTGPNGQSVNRSGVATVSPTTGAVTLSGSLTGPNGRTIDWDRTFGG